MAESKKCLSISGGIFWTDRIQLLAEQYARARAGLLRKAKALAMRVPAVRVATLTTGALGGLCR
jgi:hypothetical protein